MRLKPLSLAVTTVLAATACTLAAGPAQAAGNSLTVTTIGRNGARITSALVLTNAQTGQQVKAKSGKAISLAKGPWEVIVDIETPNATVYRMSDTLAAEKVTVSGNTSITLDARKGKAVTASVDATSGKAAASYGAMETAVACPANNISGEVGVYNVAGQVYEIPNPGATEFEFDWMETWAGDLGSKSPATNQFYAVTKDAKGLPATPSVYYHRSSMAEVSLSMRTGETSEPINEVTAESWSENAICGSMLYGYQAMQGSGMTGHAYFSPGPWILNAYSTAGNRGLDNNADGSTRNLVAGHSSWQFYDAAVWGPTAGLPDVSGRHITYTPYATIADATAGSGGQADTHNTVALSKAGKLLKRQVITTNGGFGSTFSEPVSSAGWYDLTESATRVLKAKLSTWMVLNWHFHADPRVSEVAPGYLAKLSPSGLNYVNAAAPRSTTAVTVSLSRTNEEGPSTGEAFAKETVKSVRVYASHDGGRTWHAVTVRSTDGHWVAEVPEPATAGAVALRTVVADTAGDTSTQTVYNAYLVS